MDGGRDKEVKFENWYGGILKIEGEEMKIEEGKIEAGK